MSSNSSSTISQSTASLRRWSCQEKALPVVEQIRSIHVFDFDNTLFSTPMPSRQLWAGDAIGKLMEEHGFINGGWWHDPSILAATGLGIEKEEPRRFEGHWNEHVVSLVELATKQEDALTVMLTGRSERAFSPIVKRILASRDLQFDMICLKPAAGPVNQPIKSTMDFKQLLLKDLLYTYTQASELRIYEDRKKHVQAFNDFFTDFNMAVGSLPLNASEPTPTDPKFPLRRSPFTAEVVTVANLVANLDPVTEVEMVQRMINANNTAVRDGTAPKNSSSYEIKRHVIYTGYMIPVEMSTKLLSLVSMPTSGDEKSSDVRYLATNIMICPRPATRQILNKCGGMGKKVRFKIVALSVLDGKLWAVKAEPTPHNQQAHTENKVFMCVLATRDRARPGDSQKIQHWAPLPVHQQFEFEATVGEKVTLRIEKERPPLPPPTQPSNAIAPASNAQFPPLPSAASPPTGPKNTRPPKRSPTQTNFVHHISSSSEPEDGEITMGGMSAPAIAPGERARDRAAARKFQYTRNDKTTNNDTNTNFDDSYSPPPTMTSQHSQGPPRRAGPATGHDGADERRPSGPRGTTHHHPYNNAHHGPDNRKNNPPTGPAGSGSGSGSGPGPRRGHAGRYSGSGPGNTRGGSGGGGRGRGGGGGGGGRGGGRSGGGGGGGGGGSGSGGHRGPGDDAGGPHAQAQAPGSHYKDLDGHAGVAANKEVGMYDAY